MGGLLVSPNGVYKTLVRHGLNTRAKRLALVAGYRAPFAPPRDPEPASHVNSSRPGELVGLDCFFVRRLHQGPGLADHRDRHLLELCLGRSGHHPGIEFGHREFAARLPAGVAHTRIRSGRPQSNGHVERLHRTILEECWRPAFARYLQVRFSGLRRDLASYLHDYNYDREHHGRTTAGQCPAELVYGARKMEPR